MFSFHSLGCPFTLLTVFCTGQNFADVAQFTPHCTSIPLDIE